MVKNRHQEALRQRNIRRRKKSTIKTDTIYNCVFSQDTELVLSFAARQEEDGRQDEEMAYINDVDLSLLY